AVLAAGGSGLVLRHVERGAAGDRGGRLRLPAQRDGDRRPLVRRVIIRRVGFELGGAGVHELEDGTDAPADADAANFDVAGAPEMPELAIGETALLRLPEQFIVG